MDSFGICGKGVMGLVLMYQEGFEEEQGLIGQLWWCWCGDCVVFVFGFCVCVDFGDYVVFVDYIFVGEVRVEWWQIWIVYYEECGLLLFVVD